MNEISAIKDKELSLFSPKNFDHAIKIAEFISKSELVPKGMRGKPADILIAFEYGRRLGLGELQAIQNIAVINGRPTLWGDAVLATCQAHPDFESIVEEPRKVKDEVVAFKCTVVRRGYAPIEREFTKENAEKALLWGKAGPWTQYPQRMLQMRARSWALRDAFADALAGVEVREEVQDHPIKDITPKRQKAADLLASVIPVDKELAHHEQVIKIGGLFKNTGLTQERQDKALKHFGVESICTLTVEDADKLILILEGAAK